MIPGSSAAMRSSTAPALGGLLLDEGSQFGLGDSPMGQQHGECQQDVHIVALCGVEHGGEFDHLGLGGSAHEGHSGGVGGLGDGRDVAARAQQSPVDAIDPSAGVLCDAQFAGSLEQAVVSRLRRVSQDVGLVDAGDKPSGGLHDEHVRGVLHAYGMVYAHLAVQQGVGYRLPNGLTGKVGHFDLAAVGQGERGGMPACPHQFFQPVECGGWCAA